MDGYRGGFGRGVYRMPEGIELRVSHDPYDPRVRGMKDREFDADGITFLLRGQGDQKESLSAVRTFEQFRATIGACPGGLAITIEHIDREGAGGFVPFCTITIWPQPEGRVALAEVVSGAALKPFVESTAKIGIPGYPKYLPWITAETARSPEGWDQILAKVRTFDTDYTVTTAGSSARRLDQTRLHIQQFHTYDVNSPRFEHEPI